jgi:lysozyme family protein
MTQAFLSAFNDLLMVEGGYSDNPDDPGGKTRYGITEAVARRHGYHGDMRSLPLDRAQTIYYIDYWKVNNLDRVASVNYAIAHECFEAGVNCGANRSAQWLQRSINVILNAKLKIDGQIGANTLRAITGQKADVYDAIYRACNVYQGQYYITLAESNDRFRTFIKGWLNHRMSSEQPKFINP